jgi:hypothetical protein
MQRMILEKKVLNVCLNYNHPSGGFIPERRSPPKPIHASLLLPKKKSADEERILRLENSSPQLIIP